MDFYHDTGGVELEFDDVEVSVEEMATVDGRLYLTGYDYNASQHFIAAVNTLEDVSATGLKKVAQDSGFLQKAVAGPRVSLSREQFGEGLNDELIQHCNNSLA